MSMIIISSKENVQLWLGSVDEAQFFQLLIRTMNAKRARKFLVRIITIIIINRRISTVNKKKPYNMNTFIYFIISFLRYD